MIYNWFQDSRFYFQPEVPSVEEEIENGEECLPSGLLDDLPFNDKTSLGLQGRELKQIHNAPGQSVPRVLQQPSHPKTKPLAQRTIIIDDDISPKALHKLIKNFKGPASELDSLFSTTPSTNSKGEELKTEYFYSMLCNQGRRGPDFFQIAKKAFNEAAIRGKINKVLCNNYIGLAGKNKDFGEAKKGYNVAIAWGEVEEETFNTYIEVAGKSGRFDEVKKADSLAKELGLAGLVTSNTFIIAAGKNRGFKEAQIVYNELTQVTGEFDAYTFSGYIRVAGDCREFDEVQRAYGDAKKLLPPHLWNSYIVNNYIFAAGLNRRFESVEQGFIDAKALGLADKHTYKSYIIAAKINDRPIEASKALAEAKSKGLQVDSNSYRA